MKNNIYKWVLLALLGGAFFFGGLSGIVMGALSEKYGTHGFEIGFAILAGAYLLAALIMAISFFITFKRDRIAE